MAIRRDPQSNSPHPYAVLSDGSALFFAARQQFPERNLNYRALDRIIRTHTQGHSSDQESEARGTPSILFSSIEPANEKQQKFVEFIEQQLRWSVHKVSPHDATVCNPLLTDGVFRHIRFDAWIAYAMGRLAGKEPSPHIAIVTDSWPLAGPVQECASRGTRVTVCFFGGVIDTRWHRVVREREAEGHVDFLDLDDYTGDLFDRAKPARGKEDYRLNLLD